MAKTVKREIKIGYITRTERTAKSGKNEGGKYISVGLKPEGSDHWINGYGAKSNEGWQKGDTVTLDIETVQKDDKIYYNFKNPSGKIDLEAFNALIERVTRLELELSTIKSNLGLGNGEVIQDEVEGNLPV